MRRLLPLILFMTIMAIGAWFVLKNASSLGFGGNSGAYVVASKDIPPYTIIGQDSLALHPIQAGQHLPPDAILENANTTPGQAIAYVVNKASATPITAGTVITSGMVMPFDTLQRQHGSQVLLARQHITAGTPLTAILFRSSFRENSQLPHGAMTGAVGARTEQILGQLPHAFASRDIDADTVLTFDDIRIGAGSGPSNASTADGTAPLDLDAPLPAMSRDTLLARLHATPGAVVIGEGRDGAAEIATIEGMRGPVDVFLSPARSAMREQGVETHRRTLVGVGLGMDANLTPPAPPPSPDTNAQNAGQGTQSATLLQDPIAAQAQQEAVARATRPVFWVRTTPAMAANLNALHAVGALVTAVPQGAQLPALDGEPVMCVSRDVCYRGLTQAADPNAIAIGGPSGTIAKATAPMTVIAPAPTQAAAPVAAPSTTVVAPATAPPAVPGVSPSRVVSPTKP